MTIVADVTVDGILMGLVIATGSPAAIVFAIALAPEMFFLGVTASEDFGADDWPRRRIIGVSALIGSVIVVGAAIGHVIEAGSDPLEKGTLAFGSIALAYLVVEELLREAHQNRTSPATASMFFVGFIPFFVAVVALPGCEPDEIHRTLRPGGRTGDRVQRPADRREPHHHSIVVPVPGNFSIREDDPPSTLAGDQPLLATASIVEAPMATAADPLALRFRLDESLFPDGFDPQQLDVLRD